MNKHDIHGKDSPVSGKRNNRWDEVLGNHLEIDELKPVFEAG